ncbi:hypothetical protein N9150_00535 [Akkermansiaceae bacterium]|nr:hypothetical protein [Akkermansiaceae bacterium]
MCRQSLTERIQSFSRTSKALVEERIEFFFRDGIDGVVIEKIPPQRDLRSSGWDQISTSLWPPDATSALVFCVDSVNSE